MVGARVNGKLVPIEYEIQNGDGIEIITSQNSQGPSRDWLKMVKSTQAKNKINQWFKKELKEDNILKGKDMLAQYAKIQRRTAADRNSRARYHGSSYAQIRFPGLGFRAGCHRTRRAERRPGYQQAFGGCTKKSMHKKRSRMRRCWMLHTDA